LRERTGDVSLLSHHFLKIYSKKYKKSISRISQQALNKLNHYEWPGNVRELQHALERAIIMCEGNSLEPEDFFLSSKKKQEEVALDTYNLEDLEKMVILKVLRQNQGNITQAAKELGLTRTSLYRRMEKYDL
jgi:transcriptional regulator with PAS, ATPase and Fis domain